MGAPFVVVPHPAGGDLAHLAQVLEQPGVQHLLPERPVEPLDEGVLVRLAGLEVAEPLSPERLQAACECGLA